MCVLPPSRSSLPSLVPEVFARLMVDPVNYLSYFIMISFTNIFFVGFSPRIPQL